MKFVFTIAIFVCWSTLTTADDVDFSEFPNHVDVSLLQCQDNSLSINFSNAVIRQIGRDFISSPIITCLDLTNNHIEDIAAGAFRKLPKLTDLYLSSNEFTSSEKLFTFGGHPTLKVLALDRTVHSSNIVYTSYIPGSYPNLETLIASKNTIVDLISNQPNNPFPKLKILDLSGNDMRYTNFNFMRLLPENLTHLYLQDNFLNSLKFLKNGNNLTTLILNNNKLKYIRKYSYNTQAAGLWLVGLENLRYLSISRNEIYNVESDSFRNSSKLIYLNLSANNISDLHPATFANLQFLKMLDLSLNKFQVIPDISSETNIIILSLRYNEIRKITAKDFEQMQKLKELSLKGNQIDEIDINGFFYLHYLEKLDLASNKLNSLPAGWTGAFGSLKYLDLSDNQFISLESLSLSNTLPLTKLYLMNALKYLHGGSCEQMPQNVTVDLVHEMQELPSHECSKNSDSDDAYKFDNQMF